MVKKAAYLGLLGALAIILGYVETLFPLFVWAPGVKLGLANLAVVFVLEIYSWREAAVVSFVRILVIGFLFGSLFGIAYSLAGAALSLLVMTLCRRIPGFSVIGVSVAGGVSHNLGQLLVAMAIVENFSLMYYLPVLLVSGTVTGFLIGAVSRQVLHRIGAVFHS